MRWSTPRSSHTSFEEGPIHGSSGDVASLVRQFRATYPCRLVIKGSAGSGKSVLARLMMAELLKKPKTGDPVPVFLPLWSWSPRHERLHEWMKRQIVLSYPELQDVATYGPTAVANLVDQGGVLPILDGLDVLPERNRRAVLADGELMSQDRLILTYRGADFDKANGFIVNEPKSVDKEEAKRFLSEVTEREESFFSYLPDQITDPRVVYLTSIVYGKTEKSNKSDTSPQKPPNEVALGNGNATPAATKKQLLADLIPALMPDGGDWAQQFPWYAQNKNAKRWLGHLVRLDLRDPDNRGDEFDPDEPGESRIAWWNLHRGVPWLRIHQAPIRAAIIGFLAFVLITLIYRDDTLVFTHNRPWRYSLFTAGAYGLMIFVAGAAFGHEGPGAKTPPSLCGPRLIRIPWWWLRSKWNSWHRAIIAGALGCILFGLMIGIRTGLAEAPAVAARTAIGDGIAQGALIVILTYFIAGVPSPPRTVLAVDRGQLPRHNLDSFIRAITLGVALGALWGINVVFKHQHTHIPPLGEDVLTGLVTGINFTFGAWFFGLVRARFRSMSSPDPKSAARTDIIGTVVCSIILGAAFGFAFGINAPFQVNRLSITVWFVVGAAISVLGSEWPIYGMAVSWLALKKRELPFRLIRFLECCRIRGIVRVVGQEYQFHDDDMMEYLSGRPKKGRAEPSRPLSLATQADPGSS